MIAGGAGLAGGIMIWAAILLGISGFVAYVLSRKVARFAKRRQTLVRMVVWSIFLPLIANLSIAMFVIFLGGITWASIEALLFLIRLFFSFPDPSLVFPLPLISLGIWLLGIVLIARKDLVQAIRRKW